MLKLEVVESIEKFQSLKEEWDNLLDRSSSENIFLTWEWQFNWWKFFNNNKKLCIILCRSEAGELLGIAPLYITNVKIIKFISYNELRVIGYGDYATSEYLDFICVKGKEEEIIKSIFQFILKSLNSWHIFMLADISEDSIAKMVMNARYLKQIKVYNLIKERRHLCPVIKLSLDWDSYINGLSKLMRRDLRACRRKLEQNFKVEVIKIENINNNDEAFKHLQSLYAFRRIARKENNKYELKHYRDFQENIMKAVSEKKWLQLCFLSLNKNIVAAQYYLKYKNKLFFYQLGFDETYSKFDLTMSLMSYVLEGAIKNGITECDLSPGEAPHKLRWTKELRKRYFILFSSSLLGNFLITSLKFKNCVFRAVKEILPQSMEDKIVRKIYQWKQKY